MPPPAPPQRKRARSTDTFSEEDSTSEDSTSDASTEDYTSDSSGQGNFHFGPLAHSVGAVWEYDGASHSRAPNRKRLLRHEEEMRERFEGTIQDILNVPAIDLDHPPPPPAMSGPEDRDAKRVGYKATPNTKVWRGNTRRMPLETTAWRNGRVIGPRQLAALEEEIVDDRDQMFERLVEAEETGQPFDLRQIRGKRFVGRERPAVSARPTDLWSMMKYEDH